ncbi:MAG: winged helix-turn-helix domain-containing protein [Alphaproteobacteria bacterium]|nr:winged helix-turn-helix domain-containing protein [Alphaproteobacteria bacterium]
MSDTVREIAFVGPDHRLAEVLSRALAGEGVAATWYAAAPPTVAAVICVGAAVTPLPLVPTLLLAPDGVPAEPGWDRLPLPVRLPELKAWCVKALAQPRWRLDAAARHLHHPTGSLRLTELEARLIAVLVAAAPTQTVSGDQLIAAGWQGRSVLRATLATHIHRLRRKLEEAGAAQLERDGDGYRLLAPNRPGV